MVGVVAGASFTNNLTLTRNAERSAEQAQQRADDLQRESQRLKQEADRTQQTADVLYTRSDESRDQAQKILSDLNATQASIQPRRAFDIPNPLVEARTEVSEDVDSVSLRLNSDTAQEPVASSSTNPYSAPSPAEPGALISERV